MCSLIQIEVPLSLISGLSWSLRIQCFLHAHMNRCNFFSRSQKILPPWIYIQEHSVRYAAVRFYLSTLTKAENQKTTAGWKQYLLGK